MPLHNYNYNLNDTMSLRDKLMMSTSLSYSRLREPKTLQEVMTIANPVLLGMLLVACGGGGGGGSTPAKSTPTPTPTPDAIALHITVDGEARKSDYAEGILPEEVTGTPENPIDIGTIGDDKQTDGAVSYSLATGDAADGTQNALFQITGEVGSQILQFIGGESGDYDVAAAQRPKFTLKIIRTEGEDTQTLTFVINLKDDGFVLPPVPTGLFVRPDGVDDVRVYSNGDSTIENEDGTTTRDESTLNRGLLAENANKAGAANSSIPIGTIGEDPIEGAGTITYTTATAGFDITDGKMSYTGTDSGDYEANPRPTITVSITRTDSNNPDRSETFDYVIRLINTNDNAPVLAATSAAGFTYDDSAKTLEVAENQAEGTLLLTISASDADNVAGKTPTDSVTYALSGGGGLFTIDPTTGAITLAAGKSLDFESATISYDITVTATSTSSLPDGGASATVSDTYTINITNANEAPTGASFARHANFATSVNVGTITATDPDSGDTFTFALVSGAGDTDNGKFTFTGNTLQFNTAASTGAGLGVRKASGETYEVRVQVTDSGGATYTQSFTINEQGTAQVGGQYSGYVDSAGDGLLPENTNIHNLGAVTFASNPDVISLADSSSTNNNGDFFILDENPATAATYLQGMTSGILNGIALDAANDGGKFIVVDDDYAGFQLKAALEAGDFVVGRLNADATAITIIDGMGALTLTINATGNVIEVGGIMGGDAVPKFDNALIYIGDDSGDFEAATPPTPTVEIEGINATVVHTNHALAVSFAANKFIYYVASASTLKLVGYDTQAEGVAANGIYLGRINSAGDGFSDSAVIDAIPGLVATGVQLKVEAGTIISSEVIGTEKYVIRLADVGGTDDDVNTPAQGPTAAENVPTTKYPASKTLEEILKEIEAEHQTTPQENQPQWQPNPYTDDSDLNPITPQDPDIL